MTTHLLLLLYATYSMCVSELILSTSAAVNTSLTHAVLEVTGDMSPHVSTSWTTDTSRRVVDWAECNWTIGCFGWTRDSGVLYWFNCCTTADTEGLFLCIAWEIHRLMCMYLQPQSQESGVIVTTDRFLCKSTAYLKRFHIEVIRLHLSFSFCRKNTNTVTRWSVMTY